MPFAFSAFGVVGEFSFLVAFCSWFWFGRIFFFSQTHLCLWFLLLLFFWPSVWLRFLDPVVVLKSLFVVVFADAFLSC